MRKIVKIKEHLFSSCSMRTITMAIDGNNKMTNGIFFHSHSFAKSVKP
jgi:hypothetical protein